MQQAYCNNGTDAWNEMLSVHLVLCPGEGRPLPAVGRCNLTQFSSRAAVPAHILVEDTSGWVTWTHSTVSPCRHSLALRMSQVEHRGMIWQGAGYLIICCCKQGWKQWELALSWNPTTTSKQMSGEAIQLQILLLLQGLKQERWLFWCTYLVLGALHCSRAPKRIGRKRQRMRIWTAMPKTELIWDLNKKLFI